MSPLATLAQLQALIIVSHLRGCHSVMFLLVFGIEMAGFFDWVSGKFDACKCLKTVYPKGPAPDSQLCSVPLADRVPDARRSRAGAVHGQVPLPRDLLHRPRSAGDRALLARHHHRALPPACC